MASTLHLKVVVANKMNCGGCERAVKATLSDLPGVQRVNADHRTQKIDVTLASRATDFGAIQEELDDIGYQVQMV